MFIISGTSDACSSDISKGASCSSDLDGSSQIADNSFIELDTESSDEDIEVIVPEEKPADVIDLESGPAADSPPGDAQSGSDAPNVTPHSDTAEPAPRVPDVRPGEFCESTPDRPVSSVDAGS